MERMKRINKWRSRGMGAMDRVAILLVVVVGLGSVPPAASQSIRTETITYHDDPARWVVGQVARITCVSDTECTPAGIVISQTDAKSFADGEPWISARNGLKGKGK
jgi:hypothetical protein